MSAFLKSVLYVAVLGVAAHYLGEAIPYKWLRHDYILFRTWKWEKNGNIYEKLHIKEWKDRLPDMSKIMKDMVPKRVGKAPKSADVWVLVQETCRAEFVHTALCLCAPVIYFFWKNWIGVLLTCVVIFCNVPFIIIQRYNRPMLISLAQRLEVREERKRNARTDTVG